MYLYIQVYANAKFDKIWQNSQGLRKQRTGGGENSSHIAHIKGWLSYMKCSCKSTEKELNKKMGKRL